MIPSHGIPLPSPQGVARAGLKALSALMNEELVGCLGVVEVQVRFQKAPVAWDGLGEGLQRRGNGGSLPL